MIITSANLLDLNSLRHLEKICFPQDAWPLFDLISVLSMSGVVRLKAVENGEMIGFIAGDPRPREGISWIATICVLPEFRGQGTGRALLQTCEDLLPTSIIHLCVRISNIDAIRMYKKAGYQNIDRWAKYYTDGEDGIIMEKMKGMGVKSTSKPT
ncbi:MAG: GNAT family N-acetyltransferase [Chloroflexota bacterium]